MIETLSPSRRLCAVAVVIKTLFAAGVATIVTSAAEATSVPSVANVYALDVADNSFTALTVIPVAALALRPAIETTSPATKLFAAVTVATPFAIAKLVDVIARLPRTAEETTLRSKVARAITSLVMAALAATAVVEGSVVATFTKLEMLATCC